MRSASREATCRSFLRLMTHLAARGISCPQPVKNRSGEALGTLAGRPAAIIDFLEGVWPRKPNAAHCAGVGQALARMHLAGRDFPMVARQRAVGVGLAAAVRCRPPRAPMNCSTGCARSSRAELDHLESGVWPKNLPVGVIHADLFPDNVFFLGEQAVGHHRFHLRLQRHRSPTTSRSASTPGVSRAIIPSTSPRRARFSTPMAASGNCPTPSRTRCRCWRAARRCASC